MRLRLSIHRHELPPVRIIFSTGSGPASHTKLRRSTIADLLSDVNDLIPLESSDGEWPLEDYVVEVAAATHEEPAFECLHFQTIKSVLKEDDEVIIRPLSSDDLRIRRIGGREQISGDGRHLLDGVGFGKHWLRKAERPGVLIPPRKRRRLELDAITQEQESDMPLLLTAGKDSTGALVRVVDVEDETDETEETDADDDQDEDFSNDDYADGDGDLAGSRPAQVVERRRFYDADSDSEDEVRQLDEDLADEVQHLLQDAAEMVRSNGVAATERQLRSHRKRKFEQGRDSEGPTDVDSDIFEGFNTPVPRGPLKNVDKSPSTRFAGDGDQSDSDSESTSSAETSPSGESGSESTSTGGSSSVSDSEENSELDEPNLEAAKSRALNTVRMSGTGFARSESDSSSSGSETDEVNDDTSSSDTTSDFDDESASASDSESEEGNKEEPKLQKSISVKSVNAESATGSTAPTSILAPPTVPPGDGLNRTKKNNVRASKKKRLNRLKEQGVLPLNADFKALEAYDQSQTQASASAIDENNDPAHHLLNESEHHDTVQCKDSADSKLIEALPEPTSTNSGPTLGDVAPPATAPSPIIVPEGLQDQEQASVEPSPKRARLDLASSRRMLFSSLGLRVPKTAAAEQELREKLSQRIRPTKIARDPDPTNEPAVSQTPLSTDNDDGWKSKLIIKAVECERDGFRLQPPPFPFEQGWAKTSNSETKKSKRKARNEDQYYDSSNDVDLETSILAATDPNHVTDDAPSRKSSSAGANTIDFEGCPDLKENDLALGVTIAYKELHMDESTSYQPEISSYKAGRVLDKGLDGSITVLLSEQFRTSSTSAKTGKFELAGGDEDNEEEIDKVDDGIRFISFAGMIEPKMVEDSAIEVAASQQAAELGEDERVPASSSDQDAIVPESIQLQPGSVQAENISGDDLASLGPTQLKGIEQANAATSSHDQVFESAAEQSDLHEPSQVEATADLPMDDNVEYPHISQSGVSSSEQVRTSKSNSYQDAQRTSPLPINDPSFAVLEHVSVDGQDKDLDIDHRPQSGQDSMQSLGPGIPSSQTQEHGPTQNQVTSDHEPPSPQSSSFLGGLGCDGQRSSSHSDEGKGNSPLAPFAPFQEIPKLKATESPAARSRKTRSSVKQGKSSPPSSPDQSYLPPSSQLEIKLSQSQGPTLSRVPNGSQYLDPTFSSDPVEPPEKENKRNGREGQGSLNGTRTNSENTQGTKRSSGVGKRTLLTKKRGARNLQ